MEANPSALPDHITQTAQFSPSKARHLNAQTQSWSQITLWLSSLSPLPSVTNSGAAATTTRDLTRDNDASLSATFSQTPPLPSLANLERNSTTLMALQELMQANVTANAHRRLTYEAEVEQLRMYEEYVQRVSENPEQEVLRSVERALDDETRDILRSLAEACVQLGYRPPHPSVQSIVDDGVAREVGRRILGMTAETFEMENQLRELGDLERSFGREAQRTRNLVEKLRDEVESEVAVADLEMLRGQTARFARETKQITTKLREYGERTKALERHVEDLEAEDSIESIREKKESANKRREEVERLEEWLKAYNGLPPDVEASRAEVRRVRDDLERWKRKREEMFEGFGRG